MLRKIVTPLILVLVLVGCSAKEFEWVVKIDNQPIGPNAFVSSQMQAYLKAQTLAEDSTDVLNSTIDGISGSRWINESTISTLKRNIFIDNEFASRNLKFGSEAEEFIRMFAEEGWESVSAVYKNNGLEIDYYVEYLKSLYKEQLLFNDIFMSGDENAITDREIQEYLDSNLCRVSLFPVARINDDGTPLTREQEANLEAVIGDAVARINSGEKMVTVAGDCLTQAALLLGSTADFSNGADYVSTVIISNSGATLVYDFMEDFFHQPQDMCLYYELEDCYYICQKISLCDTEVEYMYLKQDVANLLRDVEFEEMVRQACENMTVEINDEAMAAYAPSKIRMTIE